jgi:hypothetical protein
MKRLLQIFFVFAILSLFGTLASSASDIPPQKGRSKSQDSKTKNDPEPNLDGIVEVSFKIDNVGKVQILNINSTSPQLSDYVIKKLSKIQLEQGDSQIGKVIKYRFVFKKQA